MAIMIKEVYEAFKEAGVSDDKAGSAAKAVAEYDNRISKVESDLGLLKWMVGVVIAMQLATMVKLFFP